MAQDRSAHTHWRLGTSSWSEKSWAGSFYPAGTAAADQLAQYARHFGTVEADVTYYRVPSRTMVRRWREVTPVGFTFAAKFPRSIVHGGQGATVDPARVLVWEHVSADTAAFLESMSELGPKLGPLVLQFPYFNRRAFAQRAPFLERLAAYLERLPRGRYAVELRNRDWIAPDTLDLLRRAQAALVLVDLAYLPHPGEWSAADPRELITSDFTYARLIGDRAKVEALTERFDRIVVDQSARLGRWAELLEALTGRVREGYVYANNHYAGHAPATLRELERVCAQRGLDLGAQAGLV